MNTKSIASSLMTLSLGALLTACSGAEFSDTSDLPGEDYPADEELMSSDFAQIDSALTSCDDQQFDHWRYLSALAVAAGNELGRWNSGKDFVKQGDKVQLSAEGLARCKNSCDNVKAILQLQNADTKLIPRHNPDLLKGYLVSFFDRQVNWNVSNANQSHSLKLASVSSDVCGLRYHFDVVTDNNSSLFSGSSPMTASHSGKCLDAVKNSINDGARLEQDTCATSQLQTFTMELRGGNNYQLKNGLGRCLNVAGDNTNIELRACSGGTTQQFTVNHKGNKTFEFKSVSTGKCLDIAGASAANGAALALYNCTGAANQTFSLPNITATPLQPASLMNQLKFAGDTSNAYLAFKSTPTQVSIDPMGTMIDGGAQAASGNCYEGATVYGTGLQGKCCHVTAVINNKQQTVFSKLAVSPWNPKLFYCK
jgi:hypothetical protein